MNLPVGPRSGVEYVSTPRDGHRHRHEEQEGPELAPSCLHAVGVGADRRVGEGVEDLHDEEHRRRRRRADAEHICVEDQQEGRDVGPVEVEPHVAQAIADDLAFLSGGCVMA